VRNSRTHPGFRQRPLFHSPAIFMPGKTSVVALNQDLLFPDGNSTFPSLIPYATDIWQDFFIDLREFADSVLPRIRKRMSWLFSFLFIKPGFPNKEEVLALTTGPGTFSSFPTLFVEFVRSLRFSMFLKTDFVPRPGNWLSRAEQVHVLVFSLP